MDDASAQRRAGILAQHFLPKQAAKSCGLASTPCLSYQSPESNEGKSSQLIFRWIVGKSSSCG
jgi:hypothetical protein